VKPWTMVAKYKAKAEDELKALEGLNLIIVRPAIVYGPNDNLGISNSLAAWLKHSPTPDNWRSLQALGGGDETALDQGPKTQHRACQGYVIRALWHVAAKPEDKGGRKEAIKPGAAQIYNLSDKEDTGKYLHGTATDRKTKGQSTPQLRKSSRSRLGSRAQSLASLQS
jgi:nucleoside-diphosphate-sugar epimerase